MRIIAKKRIKEYWESRTHDAAQAEKDLTAWYKLTSKDDWDNFASLKQTHPSADQVGNCVVFNVGANRYRLIGRVNYQKGIVYILDVMDHRIYDKRLWIDDCNCHKPPPKPTAVLSPPRKAKPSPPDGKRGT